MSENVVIHAEIERVNRVLVKVDVAKHCAYYAAERASFDGDDAAFVRQGLDEMAYDLLDDAGVVPVGDDGMEVERDASDGDVDITILGTVPA